jgi:hypothetical protein
MLKKSFSTTPSITSFPLALLIFLPVLFYPPLFFTDKISPAIRIGTFVLLITYFFFASRRIFKKDVIILFFLMILSGSLVIVNFTNADSLKTVGSTALTLIFAWAMHRAAHLNLRVKNLLINFYVNLFKIIPVCAVLSIIFLYIFGELNLFNINYVGYDTYQLTPFGAVLEKEFAGVGVAYRSFSFFVEPVYLAFFCAVNVFLVAPCLKDNKKFFLVANVIGGILTFSYLFFAMSFLLFFSKKISKAPLKFSLYLLLLVGLSIVFSQVDIFASSSLTDRVDRVNLFFAAMEETNVTQFVFGRGFMPDTGLERSFSAGLFTMVYEMGLAGFFISLFFLYVLSERKYYILLISIIGLLVFEPIKLPLFWMLVVVLSVLLPNRRQLTPL